MWQKVKHYIQGSRKAWKQVTKIGAPGNMVLIVIINHFVVYHKGGNHVMFVCILSPACTILKNSKTIQYKQLQTVVINIIYISSMIL